MKFYGYDTVVVGSGAAGFNAAERLYQLGVSSVAVVTEGINDGTSRNTGSDKQTYYKLTLTGKDPDSVQNMAQTLFDGGAMDGDLAMCEAALSVRSFLRLVELGVPFPSNLFGEFVGYKTDHDPASRATSAGPLTSKYMTEKLQAQVERDGILIHDQCPVVRILTADGHVTGILCYSLEDHEYVVFGANNVVYATGGPAGLYTQSVYPGSQHGATGLALEAGALGKNMTEWQYGLASIKFRWNLSGTYQQVLPTYISTAADGSDEREFLRDYYEKDGELLSNIFLKGYQWPFDPRKVPGSSLIDILVYQETQIKGRRVYLDYRVNPTGLSYEELSQEAYQYLANSEAVFGTPIERLARMNPKAIELYRSHGIDLYTERLEIAVCAQHNNGGLSGDCHWESNVRGLYPVGEVNGSHGIYRPGGSALNSGQCGSLRAAQAIAKQPRMEIPSEADVMEVSGVQIRERIAQLEKLPFGESNTAAMRKRIGDRMSTYCAHIRNAETIRKVQQEAAADLESYWTACVVDSEKDRIRALYNYDLLVAQQVYAAAMAHAIDRGIGSRGSYMVTSEQGQAVHPMVDLHYTLDDGGHNDQIQECWWDGEEVHCRFRPVRPIPETEQWFEKVYNMQ